MAIEHLFLARVIILFLVVSALTVIIIFSLKMLYLNNARMHLRVLDNLIRKRVVNFNYTMFL